jgi:hypothetical protein
MSFMNIKDSETRTGTLRRNLAGPWHHFRAWRLSAKIRRQHKELAKYVRRSAYEITAWKQDISFLDELLEFHLAQAGIERPVVSEKDNVVSIEEAASSQLKREDLPNHTAAGILLGTR